MKELETKYLLARGKKPGKALRRLQQDLVWAGFQIQPQSTRIIHDVYFDTADERLRNAGWSLRCRHKSMALELTCKQLAQSSDEGLFERREIEQTTLHDAPDLATLEDGPVLELLRRYLPASAELQPIFSQNNERASYRLTHQDYPRGAIELVMDRVQVGEPERLRYVEFEGELKQGSTDLLDRCAAVLEAQPALLRSRASKFHRGHFACSTSPLYRGGARHLMTPEDDWLRLAANYFTEQLACLSVYEPVAYEGLHNEGVHQMRVATRRVRAALRTFRSVLPKQAAASLAQEARWLGSVLGAVRDMDVHLEQLDAYRTQLPRSQHDTLSSYERHLLAQRRKARRCLRNSLESRRYRRFLASYRDLQQALEAGRDESTVSIRAFAHHYVPHRLVQIRRAGRRIHDRSKPEAYHRLRIHIKKLRYGLEILDGPYGEELGKATKALRRLQNRLGDHQDASVAEAELSAYRENKARGRRERQAFESLIRLERRRAANLRGRFRKDWLRFERESLKLGKLF